MMKYKLDSLIGLMLFFFERNSIMYNRLGKSMQSYPWRNYLKVLIQERKIFMLLPGNAWGLTLRNKN